MKKIIAIVLTAVLIAGGLGGFTYANSNSHEPMVGQKLVGIGALGKFTSARGTELIWASTFEFANPDCVGEITIGRICIIRHDGAVIYEGPLLELERDTSGNVVDETVLDDVSLQPHEVWWLPLQLLMKDPDAADPDRWLTPSEALSLPRAYYTMEIFWQAESDGLPLTGWVDQVQHGQVEKAGRPDDEDGRLMTEEFASGGRTEMVNMEQVLEPED